MRKEVLISDLLTLKTKDLNLESISVLNHGHRKYTSICSIFVRYELNLYSNRLDTKLRKSERNKEQKNDILGRTDYRETTDEETELLKPR